jgi:uncharacterized membrane protein
LFADMSIAISNGHMSKGRNLDMKHLKRGLLVILAAGSLAACSGMTNTQQRVLSGGAIGAVGGAAVTAVVGGPVLLGTAIGAGAGAVAGAVTSH